MGKFQHYYRLTKSLISSDERRFRIKRLKMAARLYFFYSEQADKIESFFANSDIKQKIMATHDFRSNLYKQQIRPSFFKKSQPKDRWHFVESHFSWLEHTHNHATIMQFYSATIPPITINGETQSLSTRIQYHQDTMREGFLWLLLELNNEILYKIIFWCNEYEGRPVICIGALQGGKATLDTNKQFTKEFWGLRPQNMALAILRWYAECFGIQQIHAVSSTKLWSDKIKDISSLTDFWNEQGATEIANTPFLKINVNAPHKDLAEVPTRKRSMYKKRYLFLDAARAECEKNFYSYRK